MQRTAAAPEGPIDFAGLSDIGRVRAHNEDAIATPLSMAARIGDAGKLEERGWLFAVADGMGGHARGEVASRLAIEVLYSTYYAAPAEPRDSLKAAFSAANLAVFRAGVLAAPEWADPAAGGPPLARMGTTLVAALVLKHTVFFANVGDSRAYLLEKGKLVQITDDHSLVADGVRKGTIVPHEAKETLLKNVLTKALGAREEMSADVFWRPWIKGSALVLCSDGLHGMLEESHIAAALAAPAEEGVRSLVAAANEAGGNDNVSVIVVKA